MLKTSMDRSACAKQFRRRQRIDAQKSLRAVPMIAVPPSRSAQPSAMIMALPVSQLPFKAQMQASSESSSSFKPLPSQEL